ncbi:hypothetical protein D3C84_1092510 [compost metagenome]
MAARCAVDARATDRQLDAVVAGGLGEYARLVGQYVLVAGDPTLPHPLHVNQVAGAWYLIQAFTGVLQFALLLFLDQHLAKFNAFVGLD